MSRDDPKPTVEGHTGQEPFFDFAVVVSPPSTIQRRTTRKVTRASETHGDVLAEEMEFGIGEMGCETGETDSEAEDTNSGIEETDFEVEETGCLESLESPVDQVQWDTECQCQFEASVV